MIRLDGSTSPDAVAATPANFTWRGLVEEYESAASSTAAIDYCYQSIHPSIAYYSPQSQMIASSPLRGYRVDRTLVDEMSFDLLNKDVYIDGDWLEDMLGIDRPAKHDVEKCTPCDQNELIQVLNNE